MSGIDVWLLREGSKDGKRPPFRVHDAQWLLSGHNVFARAWYRGAIDGIFGAQTAAAARMAKYQIGYRGSAVDSTYGPVLRAYLLGDKARGPDMLLRARQRAVKFVWPTIPHGRLIGFPGQGTHSYTYPPNNWESDNAWDIAVPLGSQIIAVANGIIGPEFGPLPDPDPRFHGQRCHLVTADNEFYYAHLTGFASGVVPGAHVPQGSLLGHSGEANGVQHLHLGVKHLLKIGDFK